MVHEVSWQETNSGEGTVRANIASVIAQISDEAGAKHRPMHSMPCRLLSPFNKDILYLSWLRYSYGRARGTSFWQFTRLLGCHPVWNPCSGPLTPQMLQHRQ